MRGVSVVFLAVLITVCCMVGIAAAAEDVCDVIAPDITLNEVFSRCRLNTQSRSSDCVAAMHRFCGKIIYPTAIKAFGVSREHKKNVIGMSCVRSESMRRVHIRTLQRYHGACNTVTKNQHRDCLAAIHRYCMKSFGGNAAGISQEIPSSTYLYIACFRSPKKQHVPFSQLNELQPECRFPYSDSDNCFAAASRWCHNVNTNYAGGITQEVNRDGITVACYNAEFSGDVYIYAGNNDYKNAKSEVTRICSISFELNNGHAKPFPKYLKFETYDNRASSVELNSDFQITKEVTQTSSFTHSTSITIGAEVTLSAELPFFGGGEIKLSASVTNEISMTKEETKTTTYTTTSPVSVPAGKAIVKEAIVMMAKLDVPYTAIGVTSLGKKVEIKGVWKSVNSYDFQIKQRDMEEGGCPCAAQ